MIGEAELLALRHLEWAARMLPRQGGTARPDVDVEIVSHKGMTAVREALAKIDRTRLSPPSDPSTDSSGGM